MSIIRAALEAAKDEGLEVTVSVCGDTITGRVVGFDGDLAVRLTDPDWPNGEHTIGIALDYIDLVEA